MEGMPVIKQTDSDGDDKVFNVPTDLVATPVVINAPSTSAAVTESSATASTSKVGSFNVISSWAQEDENQSKTRSRSRSPVQHNCTQSLEVEFKIITQQNRASCIDQWLRELDGMTSSDVTMSQINSRIEVVRELWQSFSNEHSQLPLGCTDTFLKHPYIKSRLFENTLTRYTLLMARLNQLRHDCIRSETPTQPQTNSQRVSSIGLLKPPLPTFDGQYSKWKTFKDMFTLLIVQNTTLTDVERMHYLKSSLKGSAEQFTMNLSVESNSFADIWAAIIKKFENKRILISTQLDKLTKLPSCTRTSDSLNKLLITVTQSLDALINLSSPAEARDQLLVHFVTSKLDDETQEGWELHLGSNTDYPSLQHLMEFITDNARALEQSESKKLNNVQSSHQRTHQPVNEAQVATTHASSTQSALSKVKYPCDHCQGQHYIVSCTKFKDLNLRRRLNVVRQRRLCLNCLGRHSVAACKTTKRCTKCSSNHHSMLHVNDALSNRLNLHRQITHPQSRRHKHHQLD